MNKTTYTTRALLTLVLAHIALSPISSQAIGYSVLNSVFSRIALTDTEQLKNSENILNELFKNNDLSIVQGNSLQASSSPVSPYVYKLRITKTYTVLATAYTSAVEETDSTPYITAIGTHVRDGVIAANFLPIGTVIKIPEVFGEKTFIVEDRMNKRYNYKIDIWFPEKELAKEFGIKKVKIEIVS